MAAPITKKDLQIQYEPFPRVVVEAVDHIVDIAKKNGSKDTVQTSLDWQTIEAIYNVFKKFYPKSYKEFSKQMKAYKSNQLVSHAVIKEGGTSIQHVLEVPDVFYSMVKIIFPLQEWDRKFTLKIANLLPELKVTNDSL